MKHVKTGALLALLAGCGIWLLYYYKSQPEAGEPIAIRLPIACASCGSAYVANLGRQPAVCRDCGKETAWRCRKCKQCGTFVPLIKVDGQERSQPDCPKCKKKTALVEVGANELPEK